MGNEQVGEPKGKRAKIYVALVAIILIGAAAAIAYSGASASKKSLPTWYYPNLALRAGDVLNYTVVGNNATGSFSTYGETGFIFIDHNETSNAYGSRQSTSSIELNATNWAPSLYGPFAGSGYGNDVINTSFGVKYVDKFLKWSNGALLISYIGSKSGIGYRLVVAGDGYGMNVTLAGASVSGLETLDSSPSGVDRAEIIENPTSWLPQPADKEPEVTYNLEQKGYDTFGLFNITDQAHINFRLKADGAVLYFFTAESIAQMEKVPRLAYDSALAITSGNGTIDFHGAPGLVFYIKDTARMYNETGLRYEMIWYT